MQCSCGKIPTFGDWRKYPQKKEVIDVMNESRLFKIVYYLLSKGHAAAPELAREFEVSVRTIYRDIDALSNAGRQEETAEFTYWIIMYLIMLCYRIRKSRSYYPHYKACPFWTMSMKRK